MDARIAELQRLDGVGHGGSLLPPPPPPFPLAAARAYLAAAQRDVEGLAGLEGVVRDMRGKLQVGAG